MSAAETESRVGDEDREFDDVKGIPESDRYGQELLTLSNIVVPGYVHKMINMNMPRNEIVTNLKQELELAGISDSLSKQDIEVTLGRYMESEPNREYLQKLRPPSPVNYNEEREDEEEDEDEEGDEDEEINEEEEDPNYYPGMEEQEPIDTTEELIEPEPDEYEDDELDELPPMRTTDGD